jgi:hypothetical protein
LEEAIFPSEGHPAFWDITLLQVKGEVREVPFGCGEIALYEVKTP